MMKLQKIYTLCEGLENIDRRDAVKKIISKGYSNGEATEYYNLWRTNYVTTLFNIA